ncbi:hypothetical protein GIB67_031804 [Kingdonia uniflora]|uniref:Uncharacterized protein n=1 Tax=Kingdonia uniflora TaxID=39325 RepID=A0A7J7L4H2_9MAGN|nr:hypothetical protein GIB67_031804 [Kingdonia uniflora]
MICFDLNIPFVDKEGNKKTIRSKIVVKVMELGYAGVAYNRTIKGVMSNSSICVIPLLPLSNFLKVAPTLSTSVEFHRELLGVPLNTPFRQYTRLTVVVDSLVQMGALNSGNPVLKSYDLVAVQPLNQITFDQACKVAEVDIIAIDFSEKLPFRLKLPMVKAAIERGVYFEITYSSLIDAQYQSRVQMITNAKLLVDWTRGKNLIISSAAASVTELRGPCDVTNLASLLGLSTERAKAAISKNCRSLIASALRKKQFYKETIRVERVLPSEKMNSKEPWYGDWNNWDQISSGDGDILLDDIAKCFLASNKLPKTSKAIDFTSIVKEVSSSGAQLKDWLSGGGGNVKQSNELETVHSEDQVSFASTKIEHQVSSFEGLLESVSERVVPRNSADDKEFGTLATCHEEPTCSDGYEKIQAVDGIIETDKLSEKCISVHEESLVLPCEGSSELNEIALSKDDERSSELNEVTLPEDSESPSKLNEVTLPQDNLYTIKIDFESPMDTSEFCIPFKEIDLSSSHNHNEVSKKIYGIGLVFSGDNLIMNSSLSETNGMEEKDLDLNEHNDDAAPLADEMQMDNVRVGETLVELDEQNQEILVETGRRIQDKRKPGHRPLKVRRSLLPVTSPFKRILNAELFKKKSQKSKKKKMV